MKTKYIVDELPKHPAKSYGKRPLSKITRIVVHHFAGKITIEEAAKLHVSKGWPGIGYHFVIDLDGTAYVTNDIDTVSYNVAQGNTPTIGIALRGNWDVEPPCYMLETLELLIRDLTNVIGSKPIHVHSDFVNTACPGDGLRDWVRRTYPQPAALTIKVSKIRSWVNRLFGRDRGHL